MLHRPNAPLHTSRLHLLAALTMALALLAVGIYAWRLELSTDRLRNKSFAQLELRAEELSSAVAGQTEAVIRMADFALRRVRDEYVSGKPLEGNVKTIHDHFPPASIVQIAVIDADGYLTWSSISRAAPIYLGDREHFKAHLGTTSDTLYISHPVLGRASGLWSIQLTRPILKKGKFAGVMVLSLAPQYLASTHRQMALSGSNIISVFRTDGAYLTRTPKLEEAMGKSVPPERPFLQADAAPRGTFRVTAAFDRINRTYAWQHGHSYPVIINVGLDEAPLLDTIEQEIDSSRFRAALGSGLILILAGFVSILLLRAARQQQCLSASEIRHRSFFEKNASVKLVIDPESGRIVDANPAAADYYGYSRQALLSKHITDLNCLSADAVKAEMRKAFLEQRNFFNFRHRLASGAERDVEVYSGPVEVEGQTLLFSIVHDVTARHELEQRLAASEELHRSLFLTIAEGVIVIRSDGSFSAWNDAALAILGVDVEGLQAGRYVILGADGKRLEPDAFPSRRAARGEYLNHVALGILRPCGERAWIIVSSRPLLHADQTDNAAAVLSFSDITQLVEAEESLRVAQSVFDVASEGILVTDMDNRIIAVNPAFSVLTGYPPGEVLGRNPSMLSSGIHESDFFTTMWQHLLQEGHWEGEISNCRKDGRIYVAWLRISIVAEGPGRGRRYVALFSDITDRKRAADAVWRQANFDELTGLAKRKLLEDRLNRAIAQAHRKQTAVAVLFIDLDRFKPVNDEYGHATGDELLRQVARRLKGCLREEDTVARIGGDEFIAVLPDLHRNDVPATVAEKILTLLTESFSIGEHSIEISCSIGVSLFPRHADNGDALMARADAALYAAKQAGRRTWRMA
ncbi:sensor domain-containing diguanylate cyclase [Zoogloea oleivorans]|uniref:Sensor domain-containing diguanylate cyclase n=1 Tax=Zoogloea oleivorans TaxID=1552750 RepID=A0A6C2CYK4_9RHOO|nr:diguanylate cyclase [Zoogloea oleivorans]TYC58876.1 sensor domain-containing diguanylate cyclase [Zoogloea oleivorans]